MSFLNLLFPFIEQFTTGKFIRKFFAGLYVFLGWFVFVVSVIAMLAGIYFAFETEKLMIIAGAFVCMPIVAAGGYLILQMSLYKAFTIRQLDDADYTAIPVVSIFIRYLGELFFASLAIQGLFFLLASLFISDRGFSLLQVVGGLSLPLPEELVFGSGLLDDLLAEFGVRANDLGTTGLLFFMKTISYVFSLINGILVMLFFYFLAEMSLVMADIAANTKRLLKQPAGAGQMEQATVAGKCQNCGFQNEPDDQFCTNCGDKL